MLLKPDLRRRYNSFFLRYYLFKLTFQYNVLMFPNSVKPRGVSDFVKVFFKLKEPDKREVKKHGFGKSLFSFKYVRYLEI